jgi:hypothetical protein
MTLTELKSAPAITEALGGDLAVAKLCKVSKNAANNWKNWGHFPARTYVLMMSALNRLGCWAAPTFWNQTGVQGLRIRRLCK